MEFKIDIVGVVNPVYRVRGFKDGALEIQYFFNTYNETKTYINQFRKCNKNLDIKAHWNI